MAIHYPSELFSVALSVSVVFWGRQFMALVWGKNVTPRNSSPGKTNVGIFLHQTDLSRFMTSSHIGQYKWRLKKFLKEQKIRAFASKEIFKKFGLYTSVKAIKPWKYRHLVSFSSYYPYESIEGKRLNKLSQGRKFNIKLLRSLSIPRAHLASSLW